ncbi:MAG: DsbC family protein, partial [Gammaproteobacteria bacterium]
PLTTLVLGLAIWGAGLLSSAVYAAGEANETAAVKARIQTALKHIPIDEVSSSKVSGIYQVQTDSGEIFYIDQDVKYVFTGDMLGVQPSGGFINLTEAVRTRKRVALINSVDRSKMVTFSAEGKSKGEIFVFTDTDCGYCRKLHTEVPKLVKMGIDVHYLAWPRAGLNSGTAKTMEKVWCAEDPQGAMNLAKQGQQIPQQKDCDAPLEEHVKLGRELGVRGTPAIFLSDGRQIGGYKTADAIGKDLGL